MKVLWVHLFERGIEGGDIVDDTLAGNNRAKPLMWGRLNNF